MPDRHLAAPDRNPVLTREGRRILAIRADHLRDVVVPELSALRADPDRNGAVDDDYQRAVRDLSRLEALLAQAGVIDPTAGDPEVVEMGEVVTVALDDGDRERFLLVDPSEATLGGIRVSARSPLGQALLGRRVGDQVEVLAPGGSYRCRVLNARRSHWHAAAATATAGRW